MKCLRLFCCFWFLIFTVQVKAQSYYVLPIKGLNTSISLNKSSSFSILNDSNSLGYSEYIPLPFSFQFFNQSFNGFRAYADGRLSFENTPQAFAEDNVSLFNNACPHQTIYAFWDQTALKSFNTGTLVIQSDVQTWTETYLGQSVQIILWRLVRPKASSTLNAYTYYAVRLYPNSDIDILHLYGSGNFTASVGLKGLNPSEVVEINGSPNLNFGGANLSYIADSVRWYKCVKGTQANANVQCTQWQFPAYVSPQKIYAVSAESFNKGLDTLTAFTAKLYVNDSLWQTTNFNQLSIAPAHFYPFTISFNSQGLDTGYKTFTLVLSQPNQVPDADSSDNSLSKEALCFQSTIPKLVLHEVFSSSTATQGLAGMQTLQNTLNAFPNTWNMVYYPMNFPNFGDPYYVPFAGVRFLDYRLNNAPVLVVDGNTQWGPAIPNAIAYTPSIFENLQGQTALVKLEVNLQRNDKSFTVNARVEPIMPVKNKLLTLRIALVERVTYQNDRSNGQTAFYQVVKAMLPNVFGASIDLSSGQAVNYQSSYTFNGNYRLPTSGDPNLIINPLTEHSVENFDNLYAIAFVQDEADDWVWQSASSAPNWVLNSADILGEEAVLVYPNPAQTSIQMLLPHGLTEAMVSLRDLQGTLVQPETIYQSQTPWELPSLAAGMYVLEVKSEGRSYLKKLLVSAQP